VKSITKLFAYTLITAEILKGVAGVANAALNKPFFLENLMDVLFDF
jgi:hypothetical protein